MKNTNHSPFPTFLLILTLLFFPAAFAASEADPYEYLVVSYGETLYSNPFLNPDSADAAFSKVQLFSEIGVTIPSEAITLQRNIDVLGQFGWEMITVVGSIGGDQQLVFKRPYDFERSAAEAERIRVERDELIAAYSATKDDTPQGTELVDVDAAEHAEALNARNNRDTATVRRLTEVAAAVASIKLPELTVNATAYGIDDRGRVSVKTTQDVTATALISPGQYRGSLVTEAMDQFKAALAGSGFTKPKYGHCSGSGEHEATFSFTAIINHDDTITRVGSGHTKYCFKN